MISKVGAAPMRHRSSVGDVAQLVEHLVCNQGVVGSSPIVSTNCLVLPQMNTVHTSEPSSDEKLFDKLGWWNEIVEDLE